MAEAKRVPLDKDGKPVLPAAAPTEEESTVDCNCPRLEPEDWHETESDWSDIQFVRTHAKALMGVPVGFSGLKAELVASAERAGGTVPPDAMVLIGEGKFRRPVLLEVEDADETSREVFMPGGHAFTMLLPAPWGDMKKLAAQVRTTAKERYGRDPDELWVWYLTCGECSGPRDYETLFVAHYAAR